MNKQSVVYAYSEILFSLKKEGNSYMCYMNLECIIINEINQSLDKYYVGQLYEIRVVKIMELLFNGCSFTSKIKEL